MCTDGQRHGEQQQRNDLNLDETTWDGGKAGQTDKKKQSVVGLDAT